MKIKIVQCTDDMKATGYAAVHNGSAKIQIFCQTRKMFLHYTERIAPHRAGGYGVEREITRKKQ